MFGATLLLVAVLGGAGTSAAWAEAPPTPTPSQSMAPATVAITAPADGMFSPSNTVTVKGTKTAGSSVVVTAAGSAGCTLPVADLSATTWTCELPLPNNGPNQLITATETLADGNTSSQDTVTVHVLGPPTINQAPPQQSPGFASGTGYKNSTIKLLINGSQTQSCNALVAPDGKWLCTIAGGAGTYTVKATQSIDSMGESGESNTAVIVVNPAPPTETPAPVIPPPAPAPIVPLPKPVVPEDTEPAPSPTPDDRSDARTLPWLDRPIFPGPDGEGPTAREALTNWGTSTGFGSHLPSPEKTISGGNWLWAPLLAIAFIGLIALPLRLLATTLRGRFTFRRPQLAGRNRGLLAADDPTPLNPWLAGAVPLAATAGLIVLAEGISGEVRYLRLLFAVGAGLAILNVVGVAITTRFASQGQGVSGRLRFLPMLLLIAAIATVLARVTGMEPPLVGGVLIGVGFLASIPVKQRATVNLAQVGGVLALAMIAWPAHSLVGPVDGFWASVLSELLATVCLAGLGSALILMLPIGTLPGRVVLEWSPKAWFAATLLVGTVAAAVLLGGLQPTFPMLATVLTVLGFAAVCVAIWAWVNYVEVSRA